MPRPKLPIDEIREIDVCVAFNGKEYAVVQRRARAVRKRIAEFLRESGLNDNSIKMIPEVNAETAQQLREMLNLVSQIALYIEKNELPFPDPILFSEMVKELKQMNQNFLNNGDDENH